MPHDYITEASFLPHRHANKNEQGAAGLLVIIALIIAAVFGGKGGPPNNRFRW